MENLLKEWGFDKYLDKFIENEVDIEALPLLDDEQIRLLIPAIGPQAKFKKALEEWKASIRNPQVCDGLDKLVELYGGSVGGLTNSPINSALSSPIPNSPINSGLSSPSTTYSCRSSSLCHNANIWIYPEGTRNMNSNKLLPFKKGAFSLAIAFQVPIVPVVTSPYYFLDGNKRIFNNGHAIIQCLEAVPTEGLTMDDLPELKDRVQKMMEDTYQQLGGEVKARYSS